LTTLGGIYYLTQPEAVGTERVWRTCVRKAKWGAPVQESARQRRPHQRIRHTRREAADYIATLVDELKSIAQAAGLPLIAYLLAMAKEEAQVERARDD
jgi:hypothetical protein